MVILQICAFAAPTAGNFIPALLNLKSEMQENNVETIYAFPKRAESINWCIELQKHAKVYFLPEAKARILPETYRTIKRIFAENDVGIVHSHFELYDIPVTLLAPQNTKVFWHLHDTLKNNHEKSSFSRKLLNNFQYGVLGKNVKLLSVSKEHAKFAVELGFPQENTEYVPNGIDTSRIKPIDHAENPNQFLLFGWDVHRKGVDLAIDAAKLINNKDININIVGQDACKEFIEKSNASDNIKFSAPVEDINELYKNNLAFLHISRSEGLSYALLEAIYSGLTVICSDIPENLFAEEFKNILWVKNGSVSDIAEAMNKLIDGDYIVDQEDINANRRIVDDKYSMNAWAKKVIGHYFS